MRCSLCGRIKKLIKHHTSYTPEKTIEVCRGCHVQIHKTDMYPNLKPKDGPKLTSIQIDNTTLERLKEKKLTKRESYDEILNRLLDKED